MWIDANHDGISQPSELYALAVLGINSISLRYRSSKWTDQFGNTFRYVAQVNQGGKSADRWAFDVFLVTEGQTSVATSTHANYALLVRDDLTPLFVSTARACFR